MYFDAVEAIFHLVCILYPLFYGVFIVHWPRYTVFSKAFSFCFPTADEGYYYDKTPTVEKFFI